MSSTPRKLPAEVLDQVMRRLAATYGRRFWQQWEGVRDSDVRAVWARELAGYEQRHEVFAWAFENLPEDPLNAVAFRNLCRRAPMTASAKALEAPPIDPKRAAEVLAQAKSIFATERVLGGLAWAQAIVERKERGEPVSFYALREARAALQRAAGRLLKPAFDTEDATESNTAARKEAAA